ncbi:MAG: C40 family peptidase [Lachnospiraceae bacterium]
MRNRKKKWLFVSIGVPLLGILLFILMVGAIADQQQKAVAIYQKEQEGNSGGGDFINDGTVVSEVWSYLIGRGVPHIQAAAILGNMEAESSLNPGTVEAGNGIGFGLCQWSFGRRKQLEAYAANFKQSVAAVGTQMDFFWLEYAPDANREGWASFQWIVSQYSYERFIAAKTIEEATEVFCHGWERCKKEESISHLKSRRIPQAKAFYDKYHNYKAPGQDINGNAVTTEAVKYLGSPYVWGAQGPNTFDCSGFVYYVFKQSNTYNGGRMTANGYMNASSQISESEAKAGDLVFWGRGHAHHVGIYMGDGTVIHAPQTGDVVKISPLWGDYYFGRFPAT